MGSRAFRGLGLWGFRVYGLGLMGSHVGLKVYDWASRGLGFRASGFELRG